jgi:hypothetical protein
MAGSKNWSSGDVLNAADVNSILANQVVMVFADSSARDAGFGGSGEPTLAEGMFCFLTGSNEVQVYGGAAWVTIGDPDTLVVDAANSRVGINEGTPDYPLHVTSAGTTRTLKLENTDATANASNNLSQFIYSADADCTGAYFISFADSAGEIGSVTCASTSAVAFNTTSDYRLKENVADLTDAVDIVEQLRPVAFTFIRDDEHRVHHGFLAHEVADLVPHAVSGEKDRMQTVDGVDVAHHQMIDLSKFVPVLVAAVRELSARVAALEAA